MYFEVDFRREAHFQTFNPIMEGWPFHSCLLSVDNPTCVHVLLLPANPPSLFAGMPQEGPLASCWTQVMALPMLSQCTKALPYHTQSLGLIWQEGNSPIWCQIYLRTCLLALPCFLTVLCMSPLERYKLCVTVEICIMHIFTYSCGLLIMNVTE